MSDPAAPETATDPAAPEASTGLATSEGRDPEAQAGASTTQADVDRLAFDQALSELQAVVAKLETGGLPLESSIELYERGVALHAHCARLLTQAELRVQRLVEAAGGRLATLDLRPEDET